MNIQMKNIYICNKEEGKKMKRLIGVLLIMLLGCGEDLPLPADTGTDITSQDTVTVVDTGTLVDARDSSVQTDVSVPMDVRDASVADVPTDMRAADTLAADTGTVDSRPATDVPMDVPRQ
jgi:hypothetical protein